MRKVLNTIWTRAENGQNPSQKTLSRYLWNPQKKSVGPREIRPWNTASESLEQQNTSPKASNSKTRCKTVAKSGHRTPLPKASNSKTQAVAVDAKSPKHQLDTSRKRPKLQIQDADRPLRRTLTPPLGTLRQQMWNKCIEPTKRSFERIRAHAMQKADKGGADYSPSASNIANNILGSGKTETTLRKSRLEAQLPSIKLLGNSTRKHAAKLSRNLATEHRFRKPRTAKHKR